MNDSSHEEQGSGAHGTTFHDRNPPTDGGEIAGVLTDGIPPFGERAVEIGPLGAVLALERGCTSPKSLGEVVIFPSTVLSRR